MINFSRLLKLNPVNLDLTINKLVYICDHSSALYVHEDKAGRDVRLQGRVSPGSAARVHVEFTLLLVGFEFVGVAAD